MLTLSIIDLNFQINNLEKMNKFNEKAIPESEAGKRHGDGTGSVAMPSTAVGGQEVEKSGQEAMECIEKDDSEEEIEVEKVKSKGKVKLEIRKPIARFGPLMGSNLVTINKEKGKTGEKYTSNPVYTVYFQCNKSKLDQEIDRRKVLYSTAAASRTAAASKKQQLAEKGGAAPPSLHTALGVDSIPPLAAEPANLGVDSFPPLLATLTPGSSSGKSSLPAKEGEPLGSMKALSKSLDAIEEQNKPTPVGGNCSSDSDTDSEGDGGRPTDTQTDADGRTTGTDGKPWEELNRQQKKSRTRRRPKKTAEGGQGHPTTSTPIMTKPAAKRTRLDANLTNEPNDNKKTEPPKKRDKLSYAQALKSENPMVEIRASDPNIPLDQVDFVHIDVQTLAVMLDDVEDRVDSTEDDWDIKEDKGVAHGACWFLCGNQATVNTWIRIMKNIQPPEGRNYTYLTYDPNNRPYRYFTVRTRTEFVSKFNNEQLAKAVRRCTPYINITVVDPITGEDRKCHIRCLGSLPPREGVKTDPNYTVIKLEIEELLFQPIIEKKGWIKIGMNPHKLQGGGLAEAIKSMELAEKEGASAAKSLAAGLATGLQTDRMTEAETSDNN